MRVLNNILIALLFAGTAARAELPPRELYKQADVADQKTLQTVEWAQGEPVAFLQSLFLGGKQFDFGTNAVVLWTVITGQTNCYISVMGERVSNSVYRFSVSAPDANLPAGRYRGYVRAYVPSVSVPVVTNMLELSRQTITVRYTPDLELTNVVAARAFGYEADPLAMAAVSNLAEEALTSVAFAGAWYHPDWFSLSLVPYPYRVITIGVTQAVNSVYVRSVTVDSAAGYLLAPDVLHQSSFTGRVEYLALSNCSISRVAVTNYGFDGYSTTLWDAVAFDDGIATGAIAELSATLNDFVRTTQLVYVASNVYSYYQYQGDVPGSLRSFINTSLFARAANSNASINLYEDGWPSYGSGGSWTRNTNCWIGNINLTCASPYNSQGNQVEKGGTAITRQHIAYAHHYPITNGASLLFVDLTNGLHWRQLVDSRRILATDCRIGLLNEPLPGSITPAMLMRPSDNGRFLGTLNMSGGIGVRAIHLKAVDQISLSGPKVFAKWACYAAVVGADTETGMISPSDVPIGRTIANHPFSYGAIGGDSGQPTFVIIGTNVVLYSTFYSSIGGPSIGYLAPHIEAAIAAMGNSVHTNLDYVNLGAWRDYALPPVP